MISIKRDDGTKRATLQSLRNERIDAKTLERQERIRKWQLLPQNEFEKHPYEEGLNRVVGKKNQQR